MQVDTTPLPGLLRITPRVFEDSRGFFLETFHAPRYDAHGIRGPFVQDNWSRSVKDTLRGLHLQHPRGQGKLVSVTRGAVWDVAVDVRRGSPTFGQWHAEELTEANRVQLWIPPGFAHGFCVLSDVADFVYKCTEVYDAACEKSIAWNDPQLRIAWPVKTPLLSKKDAEAATLAQHSQLPAWQGD
jgi:dTDP-4-dehydrorhamnose 3,5-epimerase